jgi:membrane protein YqaA with SNARE-associated domain
VIVEQPIFLGDAPVIGFGQEALVAPAAAASGPSPWTVALVTSVLGATTTWALDEFVRTVRERRQ